MSTDAPAPSGVDEVHVLRTSEGMSCDGDTVSVTAATLPSLEDVVLGAVPGIPRVRLHNKVPAHETGEDSTRAFHQAADGELGPFVLVVEGSVPDENINGDGYWTSTDNDPRTGEPITLDQCIDRLVPEEGIGVGFHEAVRGVLSHHPVIRDKKIANYHPHPPTPWNAGPRDVHGTPGPYEDAVQGCPIFEENGPDDFKGIDSMRTVRSFDPCLPCGVHMHLGGGRTLRQHHSPTFGAVS
ncbi:hypothetical protein GCM10010420_15750 [Streptomyces glaucosporus]|uniref:Uncharacterized protein n=1 Tax=Streptomyces glaucosporus TaxID=284044 RepID=A0ABP5V4X5_9ACTN